MRTIAVALAILATVFALSACTGQPVPVDGAPVGVAGGTYRNVSPAQLKQMLTAKDFVLVNVHIPYAGELAQTDAFIPYTDIEQSLSKLPADKNGKVVLYCSSGHMSGIAASTLVKLGYTNIWNLDGGMAAWQNAGYELVTNRK